MELNRAALYEECYVASLDGSCFIELLTKNVMLRDWMEVALQYRPVVLSRIAPHKECDVARLDGSCFTVPTSGSQQNSSSPRM